jgi:DNA integrity scanning protein DisA with diadenylate cyclase activity
MNERFAVIQEDRAGEKARFFCASRVVIKHGHALAKEIGAQAMLIYADSLIGDPLSRELLETIRIPKILMTHSQGESSPLDLHACTWVRVPDIRMTRIGQIKVALLVCLAKGILQPKDRLLCLTGMDRVDVIDTLLVLDLSVEQELFTCVDMMKADGDVVPEVFERLLGIATHLAIEGREGRPIGTIFVVGDVLKVLAQSRGLILNPFQGHSEADRNVLDPRVEETVKEFAAIDGAFVVRGDGVVLTAGTLLLSSEVAASLPMGLGSRHAAAAAITASTHAIAIAVSASTGIVSVYKAGQLVTDIHPSGVSRRLLA